MHPFDTDISLTPQGEQDFAAIVSDHWSVNGIPDGGYLMAMVASAMMRRGEKQATPMLTANFISRTRPGRAVIQVTPMVRSARFDRFDGRLIQGGKERVRMFGTFAGQNNDAGEPVCPNTRQEKIPPPVAGFDDCIRIPNLPRYTIFQNFDTRLDPACTGWMQDGDLTEKSEIKGWIQFEDERPLDSLAITLMADAFPPAVLASHGMVAWVPTLEMSISIRTLPVTRRVKCIFRTHFISCGLLEEDGEIWDEADRIVAVSRQFADFRPTAPEQ